MHFATFSTGDIQPNLQFAFSTDVESSNSLQMICNQDAEGTWKWMIHGPCNSGSSFKPQQRSVALTPEVQDCPAHKPICTGNIYFFLFLSPTKAQAV